MNNESKISWEDNLIKLFNSSKNNKCEFSSKEEKFYRKFIIRNERCDMDMDMDMTRKVKYVYYNGIISILRESFYSNYDYKKSISQNRNRNNENDITGNTRKKRRKKRKTCYINKSLHYREYDCSTSGGGSSSSSSEDSDDDENEKYGFDRKTSGLRHGKIVDSQLRKISNMEWKHHEENNEEISKRMINSFGAKGPDPTTVKIIEFYENRDWKIVYSQFVVYCDEMKLATAVDAICMDSDYHLILLEIKTGYKNYLLKSSGNMDILSPMSEVSNCPLNQHYLQLLMAKLMIEKLWKVKVYSSYVVQAVGDNTPIAHRLPEWLISKENDIWDYISIKRFIKNTSSSRSSSSSSSTTRNKKNTKKKDDQ